MDRLVSVGKAYSASDNVTSGISSNEEEVIYKRNNEKESYDGTSV